MSRSGIITYVRRLEPLHPEVTAKKFLKSVRILPLILVGLGRAVGQIDRAVSRSSVSRIVGFSVVVCVVRSACGSFPVVCFYGFGLVCFVFVGFCVVVRLVVVPVRGSFLSFSFWLRCAVSV